jgi:Rrf2 family iron-sulfur cluster assembly transcriptional regulator
MALAAADGQLTVRELAEREALPEPTVAKVVHRLRRAGLVRAERGRNGGYSLARPADELTLAAVLEPFDSSLADGSFCRTMSRDGTPCTHLSRCGLRPIWRNLTELIGDFLSGITLADLLADRGGSHRPGQGGYTAQLPLEAGTACHPGPAARTRSARG